MRRALIVLQVTWGTLACALALCYLLSRVLTDRLHATQYLFWTPWLVYVIAVAVLALLARLCAGGARPRRDRKRRAWTWRFPILAIACILVHVALSEWRVWRYVVPVQPAPPDKTLRVMHWNMTYAVPYWWDKYIAGVLKAPRPDVLIVTNPTLQNDLPALAAALGPGYTARRAGIFGVFTRLPIVEATPVSLGIPTRVGATAAPPGMGARDGAAPETDYLPEWSPIPRTGSNVYDPGHALCLRLDAREKLGREIVIWAIDMPSQPREWRMDQARAGARRLHDLLTLPPARGGFSAPDLVLGDFNTPRGSASLKLLSRGFPSAFSQAGRGHTATWPRTWAVFHIDHMFIGPGLRATSYRVMDLGISEHRAQIAEITPD